MNPLGIGKIITEKKERDAIHVAVYPAVADHNMSPGEEVGISWGDRASKHAARNIGIVDPFLKEGVEEGETFWIFLFPGTVTALRHSWEHPDIVKDTHPDDEEEDDGCRGC